MGSHSPFEPESDEAVSTGGDGSLQVGTDPSILPSGERVSTEAKAKNMGFGFTDLGLNPHSAL